MKLYYFDFPGRGESIRLLLTHANVQFEDVRIPLGPEWFKWKGKFELGQVPVLEIEPGKFLTQSYAIMEYLGAKYGYLPKNYAKLYNCIFVMNTMEDMIVKAGNAFYPPPVRFTSEEGRKEIIEKIKNTEGKLFFGAIEKKLKENCTQDFIVGHKLSIADFYLMGMLKHLYSNEPTKALFQPIIESFPLLKSYFEKRFAEFNSYYHKCANKLYYFTSPGRAEMIRILFRHLKIPFDDIRFTQEQWKGEKKSGKFELEQVPTLICEPCGQNLNQSDAIIQSLGQKYGLFPKKPEKIYSVTWICHTVKDMIDNLVNVHFSEIAEDKKKQLEKEYYEQKAPVLLEALQNHLKANKSQDYFVGGKFTIADFAFIGMLRGLVFSPVFPEYKQIFEKYPLLVRFHEIHKDL